MIGAPTDGISEYVLEFAFAQAVTLEEKSARLGNLSHVGTKVSRSPRQYNDCGRVQLQHGQAFEPLR